MKKSDILKLEKGGIKELDTLWVDETMSFDFNHLGKEVDKKVKTYIGLHKAKRLCEQNKVELLYLCKFGSHLYGTNTENSDLDLKGIFLPSKEQCFLGNASKSLNYSSGNKDARNTQNDLDIQLWSLQYFLQLVQKGEINALDLLYSATYPNMVLYGTPIMEIIFHNHDKLYNIKDCNAYFGYALGQAKKYGIKGSRLHKIKEVYKHTKYLFKFNIFREEDKLSVALRHIIRNYYDKSYCFTKEINDIESLVLCGKVHQGNIKISEFLNRLERIISGYGERAELARQNKGVDWKALSHAMRALFQMEELITTGKIQYPLSSAEVLLKIKNGDYDFNRIEELISYNLSKIKRELEELNPTNHKDKKLIKSIILNAYRRKNEYISVKKDG